MKQLDVDIFDPVSPPRVFVIHGQTQSLAAIVDGAGSWGSGNEAANHARELLFERWLRAPRWSVAGLAHDILAVTGDTPEHLRDPEFGWSYSVTCVLCAEEVITCVAAGAYRVDVSGSSGVTTLFRPDMLVDQLLANGTLTPETAATFPHRDICVGPFVGDRDEVPLTTKQHTLAPGEVLLVTHHSRFDAAKLRSNASAAALAASASQGYPCPVMVVTPRR